MIKTPTALLSSLRVVLLAALSASQDRLEVGSSVLLPQIWKESSRCHSLPGCGDDGNMTISTGGSKAKKTSALYYFVSRRTEHLLARIDIQHLQGFTASVTATLPLVRTVKPIFLPPGSLSLV